MPLIIDDVSLNDFHRAFRDLDRANQFSSEALDALYDHLDGSAEDVTLDVIAICCEYIEYDSAREYAEQCGMESDLKEIEDEVREELGAEHADGTDVVIDEDEFEEAVNERMTCRIADHTFILELRNGGLVAQDC